MQQLGADREIRLGIEGLRNVGRVEIDEETVLGVAGLTMSETVHELELPEAAMHTWCALDAVGIPVALGLSAQLTTICPHCGDTMSVDVRDGQAQAETDVRLFCPTAPCSDVRAEFCTMANLFCTSDHLGAWREASPGAEGEELDLNETAALGRAMWGRFASHPPGDNTDG